MSQESVDEARGKEAMAKASGRSAAAHIDEAKALVTLAEAKEAAAKTRIDAADAAIQGARGAALAARASAVLAERMLGFATLSVPFAGIVAARFVDPGISFSVRLVPSAAR